MTTFGSESATHLDKFGKMQSAGTDACAHGDPSVVAVTVVAGRIGASEVRRVGGGSDRGVRGQVHARFVDRGCYRRMTRIHVNRAEE